MTITPYSLPSLSRVVIVSTMRLITFSMSITLADATSRRFWDWSSPLRSAYEPSMSSTLITRLASPAMATP